MEKTLGSLKLLDMNTEFSCRRIIRILQVSTFLATISAGKGKFILGMEMVIGR